MQKEARISSIFTSIVVGYALLSATVAFVFPTPLFAYESAPISHTKPASYITDKGAQLNGQANPGQMPDAVSWFEWGLSGSGTAYVTPTRAVPGRINSNILTNTSSKIIGLAPGTQYFFRHIVESSRGKDTGQTTYFTTKPRPNDTELVIVETNATKMTADNYATLRGYVSPHGNANTESWFEWGTTQRMEMQTPRRRAPQQAGPIEVRITNLVPGSIYFYRAVAENSSGRSYGVSRVFTTTGTTPPPPEQAVAQQLPRTSTSGDGVVRTTSSSGTVTNATVSKTTTQSATASNGLPGIHPSYRPGNLWSTIFKKKSTTNTMDTTATTTLATGSITENGGVEQLASVGATQGAMGTLWNSLTGRKGVQVTVDKIGPKKVPIHTPVEYRVTYRYDETTPSENAYLTVILPKEVAYIGDNTANALVVEEGKNGAQHYVFPLGKITQGSTRTFSVLGMTTGSAVGFPPAQAFLTFENASGVHVVKDLASETGSANSASVNVASVASVDDGFGILPNSIFEWAIYLTGIILVIVGMRKVREYYVTRNDALTTEDEGENAMHLLTEKMKGDVPRGA